MISLVVELSEFIIVGGEINFNLIAENKTFAVYHNQYIRFEKFGP